MSRIKKPHKCKNPDCQRDFDDYKSAKKEYCCLECKNRGNYLKSLIVKKHLNNHIKEVRKNEKILDRLVEDGFGVVDKKILIALKFNFNVLYNKKSDNDKISFDLGKYSLAVAKNDPLKFLIQKL